ncbi:MAG TPA: cyclic nucleotide-binding domain-containing protein [Gammaproteobacteria bacterium]|nr:cyclic nucleotide-binding domain-containing protein [Gammaproteobacteria bacterium]
MKTLLGQDVLERFAMKYLKNASTFGALSDEAICWLINKGKVSELEAEQKVFEHDERGDSFFVVLEGRFSYYKWRNDKYTFIRHYEFGQQIGFMSMIALHPRVGQAVADRDSIVVEVNNDLFYQLHQNNPQDFGLLMMNLAREMARTLSAVDSIVADRKDGLINE